MKKLECSVRRRWMTGQWLVVALLGLWMAAEARGSDREDYGLSPMQRKLKAEIDGNRAKDGFEEFVGKVYIEKNL